MKSVLFTSAAQRDLRKLPIEVRQTLRAKIAHYVETGLGDVQALKGSSAARLRSGDYRVVFVETETVLNVLAVGHRRDIYR